MGEKDMVEKTLEGYNDVFADILNALLFDGEPVVSEEDLEPETARSIYKADGKLHGQERDVAKYWKNGRIRIALFGLENQTEPDADMPLRLFGYDGAAYRAQLLTDKKYSKRKGKKRRKRRKKTPRYPVVTLVLYFGHKKRWDKPKTLLECLNVPEKLKPFVNDYHMNLYEIAYLTKEQLAHFRSDFRLVADYFVQLQSKKDHSLPRSATVSHPHEFLQLMAVMTKDNRYEEMWDSNMEGREVVMDEFLDKMINQGMQRGEKIGEERGKTKMIISLVKQNLITAQEGADQLDIRLAEMNQLLAQ